MKSRSLGELDSRYYIKEKDLGLKENPLITASHKELTNKWQARRMSDYLTDSILELRSYTDKDFYKEFHWKKVEYGDASIDYVCYLEGEQIGLIPIDPSNNKEAIQLSRKFWKDFLDKGVETINQMRNYMINCYIKNNQQN